MSLKLSSKNMSQTLIIEGYILQSSCVFCMFGGYERFLIGLLVWNCHEFGWNNNMYVAVFQAQA